MATPEVEDAGFEDALYHLHQAVNLIRDRQLEGHLPPALLARASFFLYRGELAASEEDLREALEIAESGSMRLQVCDAHRGWARLHLERGEIDLARQCVQDARQLVEETGYLRRERHVVYLEKRLAALPGARVRSSRRLPGAPVSTAAGAAPAVEKALPTARATVFISYSHGDRKLKEELEKQLRSLDPEKVLLVWDDGRIVTGDKWLAKITKAMEASRVAILLVTPAFLNSEFIRRKEVPHLLQRREQSDLWVIPLLWEPCPWDKVSWLASIQCLPLDGKFLSTIGKGPRGKVLAKLASDIFEFAVGRLS